MSTPGEECEQDSSVKINNVPHKLSQNGSAVLLKNIANTQRLPSYSSEDQGSDFSSAANTDIHKPLVDSFSPSDPLRGTTMQEHDNLAFTDDEMLNHSTAKQFENGAYVTQLNGSSLNETSITIPEDALLNHHSGRVRLKKKEEKLALGDMGPKCKAENGHPTSVSLNNGVLLAANGKSCNSSASEKSTAKEAVPVANPVTSEKFNSKKALEEYFIPANTHKKFLRGEKLYLSKESELSVCGGCTWKRALVSALVLALLAGAILLGALAATGFFTLPSEDSTFESPSGPPPVSQPREGFPPPTFPSPTSRPISPFTIFTTNRQHRMTTDPSSTLRSIVDRPLTPLLPFTTVTSRTISLVPNVHTPTLSGMLVVLNRNFSEALSQPGSKAFKHLASDLEKQLEDVYSDVKTLAHAKVLSFQPSNSIVVKFVLNWLKEEVSASDASRLLQSHLSRNGGYLGNYLLDPLAIKIKKESSPNSSDENVSSSPSISSPAIEERTEPRMTFTTSPSFFHVSESTLTSHSKTDEVTVPVITTEKSTLTTPDETIDEQTSIPGWQTTHSPIELSTSTFDATSISSGANQEQTSNPEWQNSTATLPDIPTSAHSVTSYTVSSLTGSSALNEFHQQNTSQNEDSTTKLFDSTDDLHSNDVATMTTHNGTFSYTETFINATSSTQTASTIPHMPVPDFTTEPFLTEADVPTEQLDLNLETTTTMASKYSEADTLNTGSSTEIIVEVTTAYNVKLSEAVSTLKPASGDSLVRNATFSSDDSLLTVAPPTTTIKENISETEMTDSVFLETVYNTSDETMTVSITTDPYENYLSNSTNESEQTHRTFNHSTEIAPTLDSFASSIWNETDDGLENVPTEFSLTDENNTYSTSTGENSNVTGTVLSLTTSTFSVEPFTDPSVDTVATINFPEMNNTYENVTEGNWINTMSNNDSLNFTNDFTDIVISTENNTSIFGSNENSTGYENITSDVNNFEATIYKSNDSENNNVLTTTSNDFTYLNENNTTNYTAFTPSDDHNLSVTTEMSTATQNSTDSIFTSVPDFWSQNITETNASSLKETAIDSEALEENGTMEADAAILNTTLIPSESNDTFVDEEVMNGFNESSDMYHHTPDADNSSFTEGCLDGEFQCPGGSECFGPEMKCNGMNDCPDHSDESDCEVNCGQNFQCTNSSQCIMLALHCDGVVDCNDGSDEIGCSPTACDQHEVMCLDRSVCIKPLEICDKRYNCHDKSDERDCVDRSACVASGQFYCPDGLCLPPGLQCDGYKDCKKGEDEENCTCLENQFQCADGKCIELAYRCDGLRNCSDGSDEMECMRVDEKGAVQVFSGVSNSWNLLCVSPDMPWEEPDGHKLCQELGFSSAESVGHMSVLLDEGMMKENAGWSLKNMTVAVNASYWTTGMTHTNSCESRLVATLVCTRYECGAILSPEGQVQPWEQWPFIVTISSSAPQREDEQVHAASIQEETKGTSNSPTHVSAANEKNESCRAEILSPLWLVTTASCLQHMPRHNLFARVDQLDISPNNNAFLLPNASQWRQVSSTSMHPHLSRFRSHILNDYDLALVKLEQPLGFKKMAAVCLPDAEVNPGITCFTGSLHSLQKARQQRQQQPQAQLGNEPSPAQASQDQVQEQAQQAPPAGDGLGKEPADEAGVDSESVSTGSSVQASFLALMVQDRSSCNEDQHYRSTVGSHMFCTDSSHKLCHDEAAPLMCYSIKRKWYLAGLLSYHRFCGIYKKHPSIYTNVFPMRSYIEKVIGMKMYNVTYDPTIYVLTPPDSTVPPTTMSSPLVDFVNSSGMASQYESFMQRNYSSEDALDSVLGNVTTYQDENYTGSTNESSFEQALYEDIDNETKGQNFTHDIFYKNLKDSQQDLQSENTSTEVWHDNFSLNDSHVPESKVIYNGTYDTDYSRANESIMTQGVGTNSDIDYESLNNYTTSIINDFFDYTTEKGDFPNENDTDISIPYLTVDNFANITDETDPCNQTSVQTFLCLSGDRCVSFASVCDGNYDCPDQSDEWQCIRLNERTGILELRHLNPQKLNSDTAAAAILDNWSPVCADQWQGFLSHRVCHQLGYKSSLVTGHVTAGNHSSFFRLQNADARLVQGALLREEKGFCRSDQLLSIRCSEIQCSLWSAAGDSEELLGASHSLSGRQASESSGHNLNGSMSSPSVESSTAQEGQWPSLILLRHPFQAPCTGNVLSHKWILTAWSCILTDRENGTVNASQWEVVSSGCSAPPCSLAEEQHLAQVKNVIAHPGAKISGCSYQDDLALVQLVTPLSFGRFTNAVCLPQQPLQPPREVCFLASYQITPTSHGTTQDTDSAGSRRLIGPGGKSLKYLPVPSMQTCSQQNNDSKPSILCSQAEISEEGKDHGASLMCINENHQWELHGLATPTVYLTDNVTECTASRQGMYTSLFAYTQWLADTLQTY